MWDLAHDNVEISTPGRGLCPISITWDVGPGLILHQAGAPKTPSSACADTDMVYAFTGLVNECTLCFLLWETMLWELAPVISLLMASNKLSFLDINPGQVLLKQRAPEKHLP